MAFIDFNKYHGYTSGDSMFATDIGAATSGQYIRFDGAAIVGGTPAGTPSGVSGQTLVGVSVESGVTIQAATGTFANLSGIAYVTDISGAISGYATLVDAYAAASGAVANYVTSSQILGYQVSGSYQTSGAYYISGSTIYATNVYLDSGGQVRSNLITSSGQMTIHAESGCFFSSMLITAELRVGTVLSGQYAFFDGNGIVGRYINFG